MVESDSMFNRQNEKSKNAETIILAISINKLDDVLEKIAKREN